MDKAVTKKLLAADGLRVAGGVTAEAGDKTVRKLGLPVFVKPARAGSSLGVSRVDDWRNCPPARWAVRPAGHPDRGGRPTPTTALIKCSISADPCTRPIAQRIVDCRVPL
jgi:D-alanine-D-alanine ligase-like ATP-grasp enzyme